MSYRKIYYDEIWEITSKASNKCDEWLEVFASINKSIEAFKDTCQFKGQAADNMKSYMSQIHGLLIPTIGSILQTYSAQARSYYSGYKNSVDSGDGSDYGLRYTTIVCDEVNNKGSIKKAIESIKETVTQVASDANNVKNNISHLVSIAAYPKTSDITDHLNQALKKAISVHNKAETFESSRANDFAEIDRLISHAFSIINNQLGKSRIPIISYQNGDIGSMCDVKSLLVDLNAASDIVVAFENSADYEEAVNLAVNRDALIQQEEEASREWIQWVAVGIAVVGAIALTVVTAGGASPLVCVAVGAGVGAVTAASGKFADNYVKTGSLTDGMNWKEFGTEVVAGAVVGGISGYFGAVSQGSAIKGPVKTALQISKQNIIQESADGVIKFGSACILGPPDGKTIWSVASNELEDVLASGASGFAGGLVTGKFNVNTGDKSYLQRVGEKTAINTVKTITNEGVKTGWDLGESYITNRDTSEFESILKEHSRKAAGDIVKSTTTSVVSEGFSGTDSIKNTTAKVIANTVKDTAADTAGEIASGVTTRTIDYAYGDETDASKIFGDIWEKDLESGRSIAKTAAESAGGQITDEVYKDKKFYNDLKKIDHDHDGKIDVVQFDDYTVTKEDYDAAVSHAGKGAYKDKTVQDILGLSKDTDLSQGKNRSVSIDMTEKYTYSRKTTDTVTIDGKYTFKKDYYDSAVNAAGKGDYQGKSTQEILGIPKDTDLSDSNIVHKRVPNSDIGKGKKVQLTDDSSTRATKIHISSMKHETKQAREKAKSEVEKATVQDVKSNKN